MKSISIIVPIYNEEEIIGIFSNELNKVISKIRNYKFKVVFINNYSTDKTKEIIKKTSFEPNHFKIINLSNYFGKEAAILAGLENSESDAYIIMDPDLEDPPHLIERMLKLWEDKNEIVLTKRTSEKLPIVKKILKKIFYKLIFSFVPKNQRINEDMGDFRLISKKVRNEVIQFREKIRFFRNIVSYINFKSTIINFDRPKRIKGESKSNYNFLINYAIDCFFSSEGKPLASLSYLSFGMILISFILIIFLIIKKIFDIGIVLPGFTFANVIMIMFFSLTFLILAVLAEYSHRIFKEIKNRKIYIIEEIIDQSSK